MLKNGWLLYIWTNYKVHSFWTNMIIIEAQKNESKNYYKLSQTWYLQLQKFHLNEPYNQQRHSMLINQTPITNIFMTPSDNTLS